MDNTNCDNASHISTLTPNSPNPTIVDLCTPVAQQNRNVVNQNNVHAPSYHFETSSASGADSDSELGMNLDPFCAPASPLPNIHEVIDLVTPVAVNVQPVGGMVVYNNNVQQQQQTRQIPQQNQPYDQYREDQNEQHNRGQNAQNSSRPNHHNVLENQHNGHGFESNRGRNAQTQLYQNVIQYNIVVNNNLSVNPVCPPHRGTERIAGPNAMRPGHRYVWCVLCRRPIYL